MTTLDNKQIKKLRDHLKKEATAEFPTYTTDVAMLIEMRLRTLLEFGFDDTAEKVDLNKITGNGQN